MTNFISLSNLSDKQIHQYHDAVCKAFPQIIGESSYIKRYWSLLEDYYPDWQRFLLDENKELIGFINTIPFYFDRALTHLPDRGWDWMLAKGIADREKGLVPNYLGGLQVIVRSEYQKMGYSKVILTHCKQLVQTSDLNNLVIPIRPTKKSLHPEMTMSDYIDLREDDKIYDPWIRTHINNGAEIIKICEESMLVEGDVAFWERLMDKPIVSSGNYILEGALRPINIDLEKNKGEYREPNIWIKYS